MGGGVGFGDRADDEDEGVLLQGMKECNDMADEILATWLLMESSTKSFERTDKQTDTQTDTQTTMGNREESVPAIGIALLCFASLHIGRSPSLER